MKIDWENRSSGHGVEAIPSFLANDGWQVFVYTNQPDLKVVTSMRQLCPFCRHECYSHPAHEFYAHSVFGHCYGLDQYTDWQGVIRKRECSCKLSNGEAYENWKAQMQLATDAYAQGTPLEVIKAWWDAGKLFPIKTEEKKKPSWLARILSS